VLLKASIYSLWLLDVTTLALGSRPRQGGCKVTGQEGTPGSHFTCSRECKECEGMNPHTPKGTPMLGVGLPEDSQIFKAQLQGPNSSPLRVIYIIRKLLKCRCLQWVCIAHLDIWNTSYGQKKGQESNWQFDCRPLKVENRPNSRVCKWRATYRWKALDEGYNFSLDLIAIGGLHMKLCTLKVAGVPTMGISGFPFGSPRTKSHLDVDPVESHKVYYKGEGGGFPQVRPMVSLVCPSCPWLVLAPKVLQLCTNHLVLVLCKFVWMSEACHFFLISSRSSSTPLYPSIVLRAKERASTPCLLLFLVWDSHLSPSRSWECVTGYEIWCNLHDLSKKHVLDLQILTISNFENESCCHV
jgi:hypothetical protein